MEVNPGKLVTYVERFPSDANVDYVIDPLDHESLRLASSLIGMLLRPKRSDLCSRAARVT